MAKCYLVWPLFPHGFKFRQHKRQPVPPEPGPTGLVSADPDTGGGWTPICSEAESLEKLDKQAFLIQSLSGKSLGPRVPFIDPARDSRAGQLLVACPGGGWGDRQCQVTHVSTHACAHCMYRGEHPWEWEGREGGHLPSALG